MNVNVYNIDYIRHVYCRTSLVAFYLTVPLALIFHIAATYTSVSLSSPWVAQQTYTTLTMGDSDMKELMEAMQTNLIAAIAQSEGRSRSDNPLLTSVWSLGSFARSKPESQVR